MSTPGTDFTLSLSVGGQSLDMALALDITMREGQTLDWTLTLSDEDRALEPDAVGTPWSGVLDDKPWDPSGTAIVKWLDASGTLDGVPFSFPRMIPDHYGYGLAQGQIDDTYTWGGVGPALPLYREDQTMATLVSSGGSTYTLHDVVSSTCSAYGVTADTTALLPNYTVARHQRQASQPIQWLQQATEATQAMWYESGAVIVYYIPDLTAAPSRTYRTDEAIVRTVQVSQQQVRIVNQVVVSRADDVGGSLATLEQTTFGRSSYVTFSQPVPLASLTWRRIVEAIGVASDIYIYGSLPPPALPIAAYELRAPAPPLIGGAIAYGVQLTFGATLSTPTGATAGTLRLEFRGDTSGGVYSDSTTTLTLNDTTSQGSGIGIHRQSYGPNPHIADATTLQTWGERILARSAKKQRVYSIETSLDPWLRPGMTVDLVDVQPGLTRRLYLTEVRHHIGTTWADRRTSMTGVQYVDP